MGEKPIVDYESPRPPVARAGHSLSAMLALGIAIAAWPTTFFLMLNSSNLDIGVLLLLGWVHGALLLAGIGAGLFGMFQRRRRRVLGIIGLALLTANAAAMAGLGITIRLP